MQAPFTTTCASPAQWTIASPSAGTMQSWGWRRRRTRRPARRARAWPPRVRACCVCRARAGPCRMPSPPPRLPLHIPCARSAHPQPPHHSCLLQSSALPAWKTHVSRRCGCAWARAPPTCTATRAAASTCCPSRWVVWGGLCGRRGLTKGGEEGAEQGGRSRARDSYAPAHRLTPVPPPLLPHCLQDVRLYDPGCDPPLRRHYPFALAPPQHLVIRDCEVGGQLVQTPVGVGSGQSAALRHAGRATPVCAPQPARSDACARLLRCPRPQVCGGRVARKVTYGDRCAPHSPFFWWVLTGWGGCAAAQHCWSKRIKFMATLLATRSLVGCHSSNPLSPPLRSATHPGATSATAACTTTERALPRTPTTPSSPTMR